MSLRLPLPPTFLEVPGEPSIKWSQWISQVETFFFLTDCNLPDDKQLTRQQKVAYVRSLLGAEGVRIAAAHPVSSKWDDIPYDEFKKELKALFEHPTNPVRAEFEMRKRVQGACESTNDYVTALRTLVADCEINNNEHERRHLAMQLVIGCKADETQKKLLAEPAIDLDRFIAIMRADEAATHTAAAIRHETTIAAATHRKSGQYKQAKQPTRPNKFNNNNKGKPKADHCYGCGSTSHRYKDTNCPALGKTCTACGKPNHFASECIISQRQQKGNTTTKQHAALQANSLSAAQRRKKLMDNFNLLRADNTLVQYEANIDSGADLSTITESIFNKYSYNGKYAAIDEQIKNFDGTLADNIMGKFDAGVMYHGRSDTTTLYITKNNTKCTIGLDLINKLGINIMGETLQVSAASLPLTTGGGGALVDEVTMQFPKLTDAAQGTYPAFQHTITLSNDAKPHVTKPRTIPFARREAVAAECQRMMDDGIWSTIDKSEWVHALVTVPKSDGTVRITTDLSPLNKYVVPERHQLPNIQELFLKLSGMKYYTKLDLKKGYYHIKLAENSQPLTATMTPIGLMAYNRLPMGLKDAASVFQKAVSRVLTTCNNCIAFIDDILIYAATRAEHDRALTKVLRQLHDNDFRLNVPKCSFAQQEIQFLGHIVSAGGIKADPKNTAAIANTPQPTTLKQLQSFLGAVNYYSQHVPNLATIAEPLRKLTRNDQRFIFDDECIAAFNEIKAAVASGLRLAIYSFDAETTVTVDSSDYGLGAVLSQKQNGVEVPIAFASRTMSPAERNYATNEREALSALWACEHWEKFLLGRHFTLKTDHASLTALLTKHTSKRKSAKFTRWLERLSQFDYDIVHIKGTNNVMADFLSRLPLDNEQPRVSSNDGDDDDNELSIKALTTTTDISVPQLQQETERDDTLKTVYKYVHSTWPEKKAIAPALMPYYTLRDELYSANRMLMRDGRIVVPTSRQQSLLQRAHEGHPGIVRMKRQLRQSYWWPGLDTQAEAFVKNCIACNDSAKAHKQCKPPVQAIPVPSKPWSKVAIDVTGPFANAPHHQRFIVVLIDYMSSFPEVLLTGEVTSIKIITWLRQVFARFGNPDILVSDNGTNFTSDEFRNFLQSRDIIHHPVPVYNPERNGKVEAFNKYLKQGVQTFQASHTPFHNGIDELLFNYRATAPTAHDESPAKRLFGYEIRQNFQPNNHSLIQPIREVAQDDAPQQEQSKAGALPQFTGPYKTGDLVRKRKIHVPKGTSPFTSPFKVTAALGNYTYKLDDGQIWNAKNLVKYVPKQRQYVEMAVDEQPAAAAAPQPQQPRRSSRHNKGVLPRRFRE